jgi:hypothetical protein
LDAFLVQVQTLGLIVRTFIPVQSQPTQTIENILGILGLRSLVVGILNSQNKLTALTAGKQPVKNGGSRRANV